MGDNLKEVGSWVNAAFLNNICTVAATALCVAGTAIGTGSLHSLWGLAILMNLVSVEFKGEKK